MKKIVPFLLLIICGLPAQSQVLPNPGFENWTQVGTRQDPNNWNTLNPNTAPIGVLTCLKASGADVHSGNSALKLITKSVLGQNANGLATTGNISIAPPGVSGGVAYTGRPDSIVGWYKYTPVNSDNGFVEFQLLGSATTPDTIGYVRFVTPTSTVSSYTRFSAPIVYRSSAVITKSIWILSSSAGFTANVNSTLFVDDMELITNPNGIGEQIEVAFNLAPNPVQGNLSINDVTLSTQFILFDALGKIVFKAPLNRGNNQLDLSKLANGIYFYSTSDAFGNEVQKGKILIAHN